MKALLPLIVVAVVASVAVPAAAQAPGRQGRPAPPPRGLAPGRGAVPENAGVTPAELQAMFDAYALVQAQQDLQLDNDQYSRLLPRFKMLQDVRRSAQQRHARLVMELNRILRSAQPDENQLKERIQALQDLDNRSAVEIKQAYDALDQVLTLKQQAQFRVFEEQMERRKLDLVTRARQANRGQQQQQRVQPQ